MNVRNYSVDINRRIKKPSKALQRVDSSVEFVSRQSAAASGRQMPGVCIRQGLHCAVSADASFLISHQ